MTNELKKLKEIRAELMTMTERYSARGCVEATKVIAASVASISDAIRDIELWETVNREDAA